MIMPINHVPGLREFKNTIDPRYERFTKEYYKTRGKTNLLTDTTIEQLNSSLPDGTILYTGKQSRTPFLNDGTTMENYNVPLSTLPIENRLKNEPRKETTTMDLLKIEEQRRLDKIKPQRTERTFQQFFQPDVRQQKNLQMEITTEYNKRQEVQKEFNNQKNKQVIVHEELLNTINQNKYKQERKQELENLDNIIKNRKRKKFIKDIPKLDITAKTTPTLGIKGAPNKEDKKLREKVINQVEAERLFPLKRNQPLLTSEIDNIQRSKKSFTKSIKQQERKKNN